MASAVLAMQWDTYAGGSGTRALFSYKPLGFNSRQERLHQLGAKDRLWLVSRCPADQQYYFVAVLTVAAQRRNAPESEEGKLYGEYGVVADEAESIDLQTRFPAEGVLRALDFETAKPIKHGASLGQSLQTIRLLTPEDESILERSLEELRNSSSPFLESPFGLWTKCDIKFSQYFALNWRERQQPLAFMLYDPPPALPVNAPVFIHSDKSIRLIARFLRGEFVAGHRFTIDPVERATERERVWSTYRAGTLDAPDKATYDRFFDAQHGVRGLFVMDSVFELPKPILFKEYARGLGWGYPTGVGYRYLSSSQSLLLLRQASFPQELYAKFAI